MGKDWNKEKNKLTWQLLDSGYTPENHPEYVQWRDGIYEFEYTWKFLNTVVWESPCGLLRKGSVAPGYMSYMGIDWRPENNNPTFACPLRKVGCELNHEVLRGRQTYGTVQCAFRFAGKPYDYDNSVEAIYTMFDSFKEQARKILYRKFRGYRQAIERYNYCKCVRWDSETERWRAKYDPSVCARGCGYINTLCLITGKEIDRSQKANVFYDLKVARIRRDGTIFDGEKVVSITKGIKAFSSSQPLTICEEYAKRNKKDIMDRARSQMSREIHFNPDIEIEVLNIRAERRESRDLLQDLRDIQEGIQVVHASDLKKQAAQAKRDRRAARQEAKKRKTERRSIETYKMWLFEGVNKDGNPASEALKIHARRELEKRGISVERKAEEKQLALF